MGYRDPHVSPEAAIHLCRHDGEGRLSLRPKVEATRRLRDGTRDRRVARLPAFRSCCLSDARARGDWWLSVGHVLDWWLEQGCTPSGVSFDRRDRRQVRLALEAKVPWAITPATRQARLDRFARERAEAAEQRRLADLASAEAAWIEAELAERQAEVLGRFGPDAVRYVGAFAEGLSPHELLGIDPTAGYREVKRALAVERDRCRRCGGPDVGEWLVGLERAAVSLLAD